MISIVLSSLAFVTLFGTSAVRLEPQVGLSSLHAFGTHRYCQNQLIFQFSVGRNPEQRLTKRVEGPVFSRTHPPIGFISICVS